MSTIIVKILKSDHQSAPAKLADAEIHFAGGALDGLKLVGFAVWRKRDGNGQNVSFPSRHFMLQGDAGHPLHSDRSPTAGRTFASQISFCGPIARRDGKATAAKS